MASAANVEEWLASSNDALAISLVAASTAGKQSVATFYPKFTYPIFGEEEKVFGYKDLKMNLQYRAHDMRPHLKVSYSKKFKGGEQEPEDIPQLLQDGNHLPRVAFVKDSDFEASCKQVDTNWTPPGKLHSTFEGADGQYEVWEGNLADPAVRQIHNRIQIFVPLFIEGGSYIGQKEGEEEIDMSDADRWTLFFLYRRDKLADEGSQSYVFVGYSTIYRFYWFQPSPPPSPTDSWELPSTGVDLAQLPCRTRLSQFVILPPFQGKGLGARLYRTIFSHYHKHAQTKEFTVEDPNEAFDDLRDICDLAYLRTVPAFNALRLDTLAKIPKTGPAPKLIVGEDQLEDIRHESKIASRQFKRVVEMHLMSQLPDSVRQTMDLDKDVPAPSAADKHLEKVWQLIAKQRLYRHNLDVLSQLEPEERVQKLSEALTSVELGHARLLAAFDRYLEYEKPSSSAGGKRKADTAGEGVPSKKARVEEADDNA